MAELTIHAWLTIGTICLVIVALMSNRISVDVAMLGGLVLLLIIPVPSDGEWSLGVIEIDEAIRGFAHPAVLMIAGLFIIAAGLEETGGMEAIAQRLLGRPKSIRSAQTRMMFPVGVMSAFMNTTPVVAMYLPIVNDWARKLGISPSKLFMPLSFAAILGGTCTMIGTSSNVTLIELHRTYLETEGIEASAADQFWSVGLVGVPAAFLGIGFIVLLTRWLLPERKPANPIVDDARRYQVEMEVLDDSPIIKKSIEEAGLRALPGLYLTEIERDGNTLPAVSPEVRLQANDRLAFAGILESVVDLRKIRGLVPATDQVEKVTGDRRQRTLVEAVVSNVSPLAGQTVRASQFRTVYNAAIIAVHRNGQQIQAKIGDITLQPGDTLLLETHTGFVKAYRNSDDFYLISNVEGARPIRHERSWVALGILLLLITLLALSPETAVTAALFCALLMIGTRCVTGTIARNAINWQVLITIGAALGIGEAMIATGAAEQIALTILEAGRGLPPRGMLLVVFLLTSVFAQMLTNNGAAVIMFPITMAVADASGHSHAPYLIALMIAAACNFMMPISYQTNLMVFGPGGYRFSDFLRLGLPLTIFIALITVLLTPVVYSF